MARHLLEDPDVEGIESIDGEAGDDGEDLSNQEYNTD